ncbi:MAG: calcium-binding protein [Ignavibacteriales bacterium]
MSDPLRLSAGSPTASSSPPWEADADITKFGAGLLGACAAWTTPYFAWVPQEADSPLAVSVFGSADAFGADCFASAEVSVTLIARGLVSIAYGTASFVASAASPLGESAFAAAASGVGIDADFAMTRTAPASGSGETDSACWWSETSRTTFFALDVAGLEPLGGPIALTATTCTTIDRPPSLNGTLAVFDVESVARGDHTHNEVNVDALAIEDALASVTVVVQAAAADDPSGVVHLLVRGSASGDRIVADAGDDWVFGLAGNDAILLGSGDNTAFGGSGNDRIAAAEGDDWLFGGLGNDVLELGGGANLGVGGAGNDTIRGGSGDDAIDAGSGSDVIDAGRGQNTFLLGAHGLLGDGNDRFVAGDGADWYLLAGGVLGSDTVAGFSVGQGDRLVAFGGDWDSDTGLRDLNGTAVFLSRSPTDADDLLISFWSWLFPSVLVLDEFFRLNPDYAAAPRWGALTDDRALPILRDVFTDGDTDPGVAARAELFGLGEFLSFLA